jgi:hypothetical protein
MLFLLDYPAELRMGKDFAAGAPRPRTLRLSGGKTGSSEAVAGKYDVISGW